MRRIFTTILACSMIPTAFAAYDIKDRLKLIDDKLQTEEMLRPFGHDFLIDINATANKNLQDFLDDMEKVSKLQGDFATQYNEGSAILDKYNDTEQTVRLRTNIGFPLPSFTAWGAKVVPDFRLGVGITGMFSFQRERLSSVASLLPSSVPAEVKNAVESCSAFNTSPPAAGASVLDFMVTNNCITQAQSDFIKSEVGGDIKMIDGLTTTDLPVVSAYVMGSAKVGPQFNITKDNYFGFFSIYGLGRVDLEKKVTVAMVVSGSEALDVGEEMNTTVDLATDLKFGWKHENYSLMGGIEEIKIARMKDNKDKAGEPLYGSDPLFRLHSEAEYRLWGIWMVKPFLGLHMRSGYGAGDGIYGGADWGANFLGDRIAFQIRTMADPEHLTLSPRVKLWITQLEYSLKQPLTSKVDGIKVSTIHSLDFRLFF